MRLYERVLPYSMITHAIHTPTSDSYIITIVKQVSKTIAIKVVVTDT